jgi:hypothetical protein
MAEPRRQPKALDQLKQQLDAETDAARRMRLLAAFVERNKTRRRGDDDPPAALPIPVEPRRGGPFLKGGAAAALVFEDR